MPRVSPDLVDLFEELKQDASAMVAYGDLITGENGASRIALVRVRACSQRISKTLDEMERILSLICVFRPTGRNDTNGPVSGWEGK